MGYADQLQISPEIADYMRRLRGVSAPSDEVPAPDAVDPTPPPPLGAHFAEEAPAKAEIPDAAPLSAAPATPAASSRHAGPESSFAQYGITPEVLKQLTDAQDQDRAQEKINALSRGMNDAGDIILRRKSEAATSTPSAVRDFMQRRQMFAPILDPVKRAQLDHLAATTDLARARQAALAGPRQGKPVDPMDLPESDASVVYVENLNRLRKQVGLEAIPDGKLSGNQAKGLFGSQHDQLVADARRAENNRKAGAAKGDGSDEAIAAAVERGDIAPGQVPKKSAPGVYSILARRGVNIAERQRDYETVKSHFSALNNPQQVRLRQQIDSGQEIATNIENIYGELIQQLPPGELRVLNRARLNAAKGGAMGPKAQELAIRLDAQIADFVSDLAGIYAGGNSANEKQLELAAHSLAGDWSDETFRGAMKDVRFNLKARANAIESVRPQGVRSDSPYLPSAGKKPKESEGARTADYRGQKIPNLQGMKDAEADAEVAKLPKGSLFVAPDGTVMRAP